MRPVRQKGQEQEGKVEVDEVGEITEARGCTYSPP